MVFEHARRLLAKQAVNDIDASPEGVAALCLRITSELLTGILQGIEPASPATVSSPALAPIPTDITTASVIQDLETPVRIPVKYHLLTRNDLEATKVFLLQTPWKMQQFSLPLLDHGSMLGVSPEVSQTMVSIPGANDDSACLYSLEKVTEVVLGVRCIERLKAGETLKFQVFLDGLDQHTLDLLLAELRMYIHQFACTSCTWKCVSKYGAQRVATSHSAEPIGLGCVRSAPGHRPGCHDLITQTHW